MNPYDILEFLPVKLEDMPNISTNTIKPTCESIKAFQEIIQYQAMDISTCD